MNGASMSPPAPPRRVWRSVGAVVAGFVAVFVLSVGTDQVLHALKVYPPWGEPMAGALFVLATPTASSTRFWAATSRRGSPHVHRCVML